jgi:protein-tyrosine phosphatase
LGNIVRSPLAEHLFLRLAKQAGVDHKYEVDSAGVDSWHVGEPPDGRMRRVAAAHGLKYDGAARQFRRNELDYFDLIVAMDLENMADLKSMARTPEQRSKIRLLREFGPQGNRNAAVPDPYYGGIHGFEEVYRIVERSVEGLLNELEFDRSNERSS